MRFTLDGQPYELTPELVRARLVGIAPEDLREYWVSIDGVRWPVKQVISLATGADRGRFQSQDSRRWLRNLGFEIGGGGDRHDSPRVVARSRSVWDPAQLAVLDEVDLRITFSWLRAGDVTLDRQGFPIFPTLPRLPGLYRFDFGVDSTGLRTLYIGESVELARRANNYRNAKTDRSRQRTSRRIHKEVVQHLTAGATIEFAIATSVRGSGGPLDLRLKSARRMAENAAVLLAQENRDTIVLNIDADLAVVGRGDGEENA